MREQRKKKSSTETTEEREIRLNRESERKRNARVRNRQNYDERAARNQRENDNLTIHDRPLSATTISEDEHRILQNFRNKMNNIRYNFCPICNERIPLMILVKEMCRRCYTEKTLPKKFSAENNMDPGDVPEELKGLTEIEEMLIAQVFTVMSVYQLRGGQNAYTGNVINFTQDIH